MAANIMQDWSFLKPKRDFYESFIDPLVMGQELASRKLANQRAEEENKFLAPSLEAQLLAKELENQRSQLSNQMTEEEAMFNRPMLEQQMLSRVLANKKGQLDLEYMPQEFQMKQQQMQLANALKNMQMQKYQAEIDRMNNPNQVFNPLTDVRGDAQQVAVAEWYREQGRDDLADAIMKGMNNSGVNFTNLPAAEKNRYAAQATALGIPLTDAISAFNSEIPITELAKQIGRTDEEIAEAGFQFAPTTPILTRSQNQLIANVGSEYLSDEISELMSPYINDLNFFAGKSNKQILDFIRGKTNDPNLVGGFIAASALVPEAAALRGRGFGLNLGIEAVKHLEDTAPIKIRALNELATAEEQKAADEIFKKINRKVSALETDVATNPAKYQKKHQKILKELENEELSKQLKSQAKSGKKLSDYSEKELENMTIEELEALYGD